MWITKYKVSAEFYVPTWYDPSKIDQAFVIEALDRQLQDIWGVDSDSVDVEFVASWHEEGDDR